MTFKLKDLVRIQRSIKKLSGQSVKIHVMFRLRQFMQDVEKVLRELGEHRNKLVKECGQRKENRVWEIPKEDFAAQDKYDEGYEKLLEEEVNIRTPKVKLTDFEIAKEGSEIVETPEGEVAIKIPMLNVMDITNLSFLFEDEVEEENKNEVQ